MSSAEKLLSLTTSLNNFFAIEYFVSLKDQHHAQCPAHVPKTIKSVFDEGATCLAVNCFNAAGTMFRLCVDIATRELLPPRPTPATPTAPVAPPAPVTGLTEHIRRTLKPRIDWLLDNHLLPEALRDLSTCIREDGNDGAHAGTLTKADAENLLEFTSILLERLYTEKQNVIIATKRRDARRNPPTAATTKT
jgi:hypothetical protein